MKVLLHFRAALNFTEEEIIGLIDEPILAAIKHVDPNPVFEGFILAAEGDAEPVVFDREGTISRTIRITRAAVQSFVDRVREKITAGPDSLRLWVDHSEARNAAEARASIKPATAFVAGSRTVSIKGKLFAVIAAYFPPHNRSQAGKFPSVSGEFEFETDDSDKKVTILQKVLEVMGIALLPAGTEPAIDEARSVGLAFAQGANQDGGGKPDETHEEQMDLSKATFQELAAEMKGRNVQFHQLFTADKLAGKRVEHTDGSVQWIGGDKEFQAVLTDLLGTEKKALLKKYKEPLDAAEKELTGLRADNSRFQAIPKLMKAATEGETQLPDGARPLLDRRLDGFQPGEDVEKSIKEFLGGIKADFESIKGSGSNGKKTTEKQAAAVGAGPDMGGSDSSGGADNKDENYGVDDMPEDV